MLNDAFKGIDLLQKGLDAAWTRNSVITNNIANVDTPGFKSSSVEFEAAMKRAMEAESGDSPPRPPAPNILIFFGLNREGKTCRRGEY